MTYRKLQVGIQGSASGGVGVRFWLFHFACHTINSTFRVVRNYGQPLLSEGRRLPHLSNLPLRRQLCLLHHPGHGGTNAGVNRQGHVQPCWQWSCFSSVRIRTAYYVKLNPTLSLITELQGVCHSCVNFFACVVMCSTSCAFELPMCCSKDFGGSCTMGSSSSLNGSCDTLQLPLPV